MAWHETVSKHGRYTCSFTVLSSRRWKEPRGDMLLVLWRWEGHVEAIRKLNLARAWQWEASRWPLIEQPFIHLCHRVLNPITDAGFAQLRPGASPRVPVSAADAWLEISTQVNVVLITTDLVLPIVPGDGSSPLPCSDWQLSADKVYGGQDLLLCPL